MLDVDFDKTEYRAYISSLKTFQNWTQMLHDKNSAEMPDKETVALAIRSFLTSFKSGTAFNDALRNICRIILEYGITLSDLFLDHIDGVCSPQFRLMTWALAQNARQNIISLDTTDINIWKNSRALLELLIKGLERWPETDSVSNELLENAIPFSMPIQLRFRFAQIIRIRGNQKQACDLLKACLEDKNSETHTIEFIKELKRVNLNVEAYELLKETLMFWVPQSFDLSEFITLCEMARENFLWNEMLWAIQRYLRLRDYDEIKAVSPFFIDALLNSGEDGYYPAILIYRTYLLANAGHLSFLPELMLAAKVLKCDDVVSDILRLSQDSDIIPNTPEWLKLRCEFLESQSRWDEAYELWRKIDESNQNDAVIQIGIIENRLGGRDERRAEDYARKLMGFDKIETKMQGYSYMILIHSIRQEHQRIVEIVRQQPSVLDQENPLLDRVSSAYIEALCMGYQWQDLKSFLRSCGRVDTQIRAFYLRLAEIMTFVQEAGSKGFDRDQYRRILLFARGLVSAPMSIAQCLLILNLDIVGKLQQILPSTIKASSSGDTPETQKSRDIRPDSIRDLRLQVEMISREIEIRVAVEAEAIIEQLEADGRETADYRTRLDQMEIGRGSIQLLSDLARVSFRTLSRNSGSRRIRR